jgi:hypothetical protein
MYRKVWKIILSRYYFKTMMEPGPECIEDKNGFFMKNEYAAIRKDTAGFRLEGYFTGFKGPIVVILFSSFDGRKTWMDLDKDMAERAKEYREGLKDGNAEVFHVWHVGQQVFFHVPPGIEYNGFDQLDDVFEAGGIAEFCQCVIDKFNEKKARAGSTAPKVDA